MNLENFMMPTNAANAVTLDGSMVIVIGAIILAYILITHRNTMFGVDENAYKDTLLNKNTLEIDDRQENIEAKRTSTNENIIKNREEDYDEVQVKSEPELVFNRR